MSNDDHVRFAAATADITPESPLPLAPVIGRNGVFDKVADCLEANICIMRWRDRESILVSADVLFVGDTVRDIVAGELELAGSPEALFLAATHTHSAPMPQSGMPILAPAEPQYAQFAASRIVSAVKSIHSAEQAMTASYHEGNADHGIHRRLKRLRLTRRGLRYSAELGPNPEGPRDETVRLLKISRDDGKVGAILWNYACHPTDFPHRTQVSADFPGAVRKRLRDLYGNIPILFFQGFSGDVRPPFRRKVRSLKSLAYRILWGPEFGTPSEKDWHNWADSLAERVAGISGSQATEVPSAGLKTARQVLPLENLTVGELESKEMSLHLVQIGNASILGLSAEAVTYYRNVAEEIFGEGPLFTVNCLGQNHGYLPADNMLADGGYEVEGFRKRFSFSGQYLPGLEPAIREQLTLLRESIGDRAQKAGSL